MTYEAVQYCLDYAQDTGVQMQITCANGSYTVDLLSKPHGIALLEALRDDEGFVVEANESTTFRIF